MIYGIVRPKTILLCHFEQVSFIHTYNRNFLSPPTTHTHLRCTYICLVLIFLTLTQRSSYTLLCAHIRCCRRRRLLVRHIIWYIRYISMLDWKKSLSASSIQCSVYVLRVHIQFVLSIYIRLPPSRSPSTTTFQMQLLLVWPTDSVYCKLYQTKLETIICKLFSNKVSLVFIIQQLQRAW